MQQLRALKGHTYAQKFHHPGEIYCASDSDARLLVLVKQAEYYTPPVAAPAKIEKPEAKDESLETKAIDPKPKRPYVRRSLAAAKPSGYDTKDMKTE